MSYENLEKRKAEIQKKLKQIKLTEGSETFLLWEVGNRLKITGTTVRNYLSGKINDGYLAEEIYNQFKELNCV